MMKKLFKFLAILLLIFMGMLVTTPFFLESKIETIVQNYADKNLNADLSFDNINLSLISSFPQAEIQFDDLVITNRIPFKNETLLSCKSLAVDLPMSELLKGSDKPLIITEIILDELLLSLKINKNGSSNYDVITSENKASTKTANEESSSGFTFDIKNIEIENSALTYIDEATGLRMFLTDFNHQSKGQFSADKSRLETQTSGRLSLDIDSTNFIDNTTVKLDAIIGLDLTQNRYTFYENKGYINKLPIAFDGFIQLEEVGQQIDMTFQNPEASFNDFLAVLPNQYSENIENVKTTGQFTVSGKVKGLLSDISIPTMDINIIANEASFQYPDLPKGIEEININASLINTTGNTKDTYFSIDQFDFKVDDDVFKSKARIRDVTENIKVEAFLDGVLNLSNITKTYPIKLKNQLTGILRGKLNADFDMNALKTNAFERINTSGDVDISDFVFSSEDIVNPIQINSASLKFKSGTVALNNFDAQTGQSDFKATGAMRNVIGFLLSDKKLQGTFKVDSNTFAVSDFMVKDVATSETSNKTTTEGESLKIPAFLDCTINATAKTVLYDNLTLKNVTGQLRIKDQNAGLNQMNSEVFGGTLGISGNVYTKENAPRFDLELGMKDFNVTQSFKDLKLLSVLAPIAKVINGKLNSTIDVNGLLDSSFSPDLETISGNAQAEILTNSINIANSPLISELSTKLNFIDITKLDLKDIKTNLSFNNGQVAVEPFQVYYEDIAIEIGGTHSFTNTLNYKAIFNVPAKYLGSDINRLIGQIDDPKVDALTIPVTARIDGTFTNPNVKTDLTSAVSNLTNQLIEIKKQKLIGEGKDTINDLLGGLLGGDSSDNTTVSKDSTDSENSSDKTSSSENQVKKEVKNILGDLIGRKKKPNKKKQDSTKNN